LCVEILCDDDSQLGYSYLLTYLLTYSTDPNNQCQQNRVPRNCALLAFGVLETENNSMCSCGPNLRSLQPYMYQITIFSRSVNQQPL